MQELRDKDGKVYHIYTTTEFSAKLSIPSRTLVLWANKGIPGARWNPYRSQWEWIEEEYVQGMLEKKPKPSKEPHEGESIPEPRRGRRGRFAIVR